MRSRSRMPSGRRLYFPVLIAAASILAILVTARAASATAQPTATSPARSALATAPAHSERSGTGTRSAVARFSPMSVTYVSSSQGWVLGTDSCGKRRCFELLHTTNDGSTWSRVRLPPIGRALSTGALMKVRFANSSDGWIFPFDQLQGYSQAWSTHSGGRRWSRVTFPVTGSALVGVEDIEAAHGVVVAAVSVVSVRPQLDIFSSPVARDAWRRTGGPFQLGAGPVPSGELALHGSSGWFVQNDRIVVGGGREGRSGIWRSWQPPCAHAGGPVLLAAPTTSRVEAICTEGVWTSGRVTVDLLTSTDGGTRFGPSRRIPLGAGPSAPEASLAAATGSATVAIGAIDYGGSSAQMNLEVSFNAGSTWRSVYRHAGSGWLELGFTTTKQGVAIILGANGQADTMLVTRDGGRHWAKVDFS